MRKPSTSLAYSQLSVVGKPAAVYQQLRVLVESKWICCLVSCGAHKPFPVLLQATIRKRQYTSKEEVEVKFRARPGWYLKLSFCRARPLLRGCPQLMLAPRQHFGRCHSEYPTEYLGRGREAAEQHGLACSLAWEPIKKVIWKW